MKIFIKFIKIALIAFFTAVVALIVVAWAAEDQITKLAIKKASQAINAPFGLEKVSFSLIRDFPLATITFKGVWLGAPPSSGETEQNHVIDTLAKFDRLYISVESRPLLDKIFNIQEVEAKKGHVKYRVSETGVTCFDFLINTDTTTISPDTTASGTTPDITLDKIILKDITCHYRDDKLKAEARIYIPEIEGSAKIDSATTKVSAKGGLQLTKCAFEGSNLHMMQTADLQFDVLYDPDTLTFKAIKINTEGADLEASGELAIGNDLTTELSISGTSLDMKELSKYVPAEVFKENEISGISGKADIQGTVKGILSDSIMPRYDAKFTLSDGSVQWRDYPVMKNVSISGTATNGSKQNNASTAIAINNLQLNADGNRIKLTGALQNLDRLQYRLKSNLDIDLATIKPFIPDTLVHDMNGRLTANVDTKGVLPDSIDDQFVDYLLETSMADVRLDNVEIDLDSSFSISQLSGRLTHNDKSDEFELDSFNIHLPIYKLTLVNNAIKGQLKGKLTAPDSLDIDLTNYNLNTQNSSISGMATIRNLKHPSYELKSELNLDLTDAKQFIPDSLVKNVKGKVVANINSAGVLDLDSISQQIENLIYDHSTFDVGLNDVWLEMPDTLLNVQKLSGHVNVNAQMVKAKNLSGVYHGVDFQIDTTVVRNLFTTVLKDKPGKLEIDGIYRLGDLDYDMIGLLTGTDTTGEASIAETVDEVDIKKGTTDEQSNVNGGSWNMDYEFKGKLYVNSLKYGKAMIQDISTLFNVKDSLYQVDQLKCKAFGGNMNSAIRVDLAPNGKTIIHLRNQIQQMDLRRVLFEMDNFDQEEIKYQNVSGQLASDTVYTKIVMIEDSILYPEMRMTGDFKIVKGGIYNYALLEQMAPSIPGVKRLDTLVMKTLDTKLFIIDDAFYVPQTFIVSNALDISVIGKQGFGEDFKYYLGIRVGEVLLSKSKKRKQKQSESEEVKLTEKNFKLIEAIGKNGKYKIRPLKPGVREDRDYMKAEVNTKEALINFRFNPKLVNFNTGIKENFLK